MEKKEYPYELFIQIDNNEHLLGRVTVCSQINSFSIDIDIVTKESKKIFQHVESLYNCLDESEGIDLAIQKLSHFLQRYGQ
ncbi:MAG: hypothetical protein H6622_08995 [Halobacteriovoraceae bacterium]|nr:hypothetical protein [Halobacteriovoraceae bacterium]